MLAADTEFLFTHSGRLASDTLGQQEEEEILSITVLIL